MVSDTVRVSRGELERLCKELEELRTAIDGIGRLRLDAVRLVSRARALLQVDEELTPVRPPSAADVRQAFESSNRILAVRPPSPPRKK